MGHSLKVSTNSQRKKSKDKKPDCTESQPKRCSRKTPKSKLATPSKKPISFDQLQEQATAAVEEGGLAKKTLGAYHGHMDRLCAFVQRYSQNEQAQEQAHKVYKETASFLADEIDLADENPKDAEAPTTMDPKFPTTFDGAPKKCTPMAIAMFMFKKCFQEGCGISTADQIRAAAAQYYDTFGEEELYQGTWRFDAATNRYIGNPA
ncbi:hypothetical protein H1R20_g11250, partial [Candolleomyces eurysporus]